MSKLGGETHHERLARLEAACDYLLRRDQVIARWLPELHPSIQRELAAIKPDLDGVVRPGGRRRRTSARLTATVELDPRGEES